MACQWRIRHKLLLGLGLVVAIVALLLAGALKGLTSYRTTISTLDNKLANLNIVIALKTKVRELEAPNDRPRFEASRLKEKANIARATLAEYEKRLKDTGKYGHTPEKSHDETSQAEGLAASLNALQEEIDKITKKPAEFEGSKRPLVEEEGVQKLIKKLTSSADDLVSNIIQDCYKRFTVAKRDSHFSLSVVLSTSVVGVLLMAGLLRFFYRWLFYPIRDLQQGVGRVGQGDFEHTIELHSGDELQDLATAFNDMTGRLRDIYGDLARQVNERSRQLVRSERLAGVGFLAAGVAHEINNPLASIAFCSEALERRLGDVLAVGQRSGAAVADLEVVTKYLRMIQQEAFRCKEITQRLLEFSRGGERRREPTDMGELVQGVLEVVQHLQNCKGKKLIYQPPARLLASVNGQEIKSVVLNLIVNALDSMDEGGTLTIKLRQRDGMAELVFADTGCGMTGEVLENIFEPFFTRSRTGKGTGLGLSISHRIINQHRGEIEAVSPGPNEGSTFTVRLPLQSAEEPASGPTDKEHEQAADQDWARYRKQAA